MIFPRELFLRCHPGRLGLPLLSLRKLREEASLTRKELAEKAELSYTQIYLHETRHPRPQDTTTASLCYVLGVEPEELQKDPNAPAGEESDWEAAARVLGIALQETGSG